MVKINGSLEPADGQNLAAYLEQHGYRKDTIAVEINEDIVPKKDYETRTLMTDDEVEIVSFVGGG